METNKQYNATKWGETAFQSKKENRLSRPSQFGVAFQKTKSKKIREDGACGHCRRIMEKNYPYLAEGGKNNEKKLIAPSITALHDKLIFDYIEAGKEEDNKNYLAAYTGFEALASEGYADSREKLGKLKETMYQEAVSMYRKGDTSLVKYPFFKTSIESFMHPEKNYVYYQYFELCEGYKDADKYLLLAKATSGDITDREYNSLVAALDFEDTKEVLLSSHEVAQRFLLGLWKSDDKKYSFSIDKEGYTEYILPNPKKTGDLYYAISEGLYFVYPQDKPYSSITSADKQDGAYFQFKIIDPNTISVFCYEDGTTHILIRQ